jgi:hypothetical protein
LGEKKAGKIIASEDKRYFLGARMKNIFENENIFYGEIIYILNFAFYYLYLHFIQQ